MTWTTTAPTAPGLYGWRTLANPSPKIVEVSAQKFGGVGCWNPYCERQNAQQWLTPAEIGGEWLAFIPPWEQHPEPVNDPISGDALAAMIVHAAQMRDALQKIVDEAYCIQSVRVARAALEGASK